MPSAVNTPWTTAETASQEVRSPQARPALSGPVLWTLAASSSDVTRAQGLPVRLHDEVRKLLEGWYGKDPSDNVAFAIRAAVHLLLLSGGPGSLRLVGTAQELLIELASQTERPPATAPSASQRQQQLEGLSETQGQYRTLGEAGSRHVQWMLLTMPALVNATIIPPERTPADVWT
jgi:hypothetical protein